MIRRVDHVGRVVLPVSMRLQLGLAPRTPLEIFETHDSVVLRRYEPMCTFCGGDGAVLPFRCRNVCRSCRHQLGELAGS